MKYKFIAALIVVNSAMAGSGKPPKADVPAHRKPKSNAVVHYAKNNWVVRTESDMKAVKGSTVTKSGDRLIWNLQGAILDGSKQKGDGSQNENQEKLMSLYALATIKNGFVRKNKNALTIYAPKTRVENITFTDIGEDALTTGKGCYGCEIVNNEFINDSGGDKSVQANEAKDLFMKGNLIYGGITCSRIGDSNTTDVSEVATLTGNTFVGCGTAIHASKITVKSSGNKFKSVSQENKLSNGAKLK